MPSRVAPTLAAAIGAVILMTGCGENDRLLVRGQAYDDTAATELFAITPPFFVAVYHGQPGDPLHDPLVATDSDEEGRFVLRASPSESEAKRLYLYISNHGFGDACAYVRLPPLRVADGDWVDARTGTPLTLRVPLREPERAGGGCA